MAYLTCRVRLTDRIPQGGNAPSLERKTEFGPGTPDHSSSDVDDAGGAQR